MKKFRYTHPANVTLFQRIRPYVIIFASWNIIGICIWKFATKRAAERDPLWESRSQGEKIAIMAGSVPEDIKKYKFNVLQLPGTTDSKENK